MPLEAPKLDVREFEDLLREARLRIPRYAPEWTDLNDSDPGMAMVQLFAWLTEMLLYQFNRIPDRNYVKFLQLYGLELEPAKPARAQLSFTVKPPPAQLRGVPRRCRVGGQSPLTGELVVFETVQGLDLVPFNLESVFVLEGNIPRDVSEPNAAQGVGFFPLGVTPQVGHALYLGFGPVPEDLLDQRESDPRLLGPPWPEQMQFRLFLPEEGRPPTPQFIGPDRGAVSPRKVHANVERLLRDLRSLLSDTALEQRSPGPGWEAARTQLAQRISAQIDAVPRQSSASGARLQWEYRPKGAQSEWRPLRILEDGTSALTREGSLSIEGPRDIVPTVESGFGEGPKFWLRCRMVGGQYAEDSVPQIDFVRPNTVEAVQLSSARDEVLALSDGLPDQSHSCRFAPIFELEIVVIEDDDEQPWKQVDDLRACGPSEACFQLQAGSGVVLFGDGENGRIPSAGARIVARSYRHGGGAAGNLAAGALSTPLQNLQGVDEVINARPAVGGKDEQDLEAFKKEAPRSLRTRSRAVTSEDFAALATGVQGVERAAAIPLMHPDYPGTPVAGAVTVLVVPESEQRPPVPSEDLLRAVAIELDAARLVTTEVHVDQPQFLAIGVESRVLAEPYSSFGRVRADVVAALNEYLDPQRWSIGLDLYPANLYPYILGVDGVASVTSLSVLVDGRPHEDLNAPIVVPSNSLVYGIEGHVIGVDARVDR